MRPIPTIVELQDSISNDFKSRLNLMSTFLKTVLNAFTIVLAAQFKLAYLYLSDIQNNVFPDTADLEVNGGTLERIGRIQLGRNPKPATVGVFEISVNGVSSSILRAGLTFKSNDDSKNPSKLYILDSEYILIGTSGIIEVRSLEAGTQVLLEIGDELTVTEPVIGLEKIATVLTVIEQPLESESIEIYRQAILDSIQLEPQGGARSDYRIWASDAQGVRKVYPYVKNTDAGIVQIFVEANEADSTDGFGTPSAPILTEVEEVIEFDPDETKPLSERGRRPIQAFLEVQAIGLVPVDVNISGLDTDTLAIRNAIIENLKLYLFDVRPFIFGADLLRQKNDILYEARFQSVVTDVLENSNFFSDFNMFVNGTEVESYQFELGNIPYLRDVNFI